MFLAPPRADGAIRLANCAERRIVETVDRGGIKTDAWRFTTASAASQHCSCHRIQTTICKRHNLYKRTGGISVVFGPPVGDQDNPG